MPWLYLLVCLSTMLSTILAADFAAKSGAAPSSPRPADDQNGQVRSTRSSPASDTSSADSGGGVTTQKASESVFGAGCRWDPTTSNIEEVTFQFRTGQAPPSTWFATSTDSTDTPGSPKLQRRGDVTVASTPGSDSLSNATGHRELETKNALLDSSYHTRLIDVLTFRARYGSFGSSLNSAGCALPAFSEKLAQLEAQEGEIVNNYMRMHKPVAGSDDTPNAMFFWAGVSNYDPSVKSDLIQTVVFYGDGCAANPRQGLCVYAAEYSNFRYDPADHMCMGSNMPVFYPIDTDMTVVYRTQTGFRTQESWINGKMVSYLRSAGDQVMNSFVITQECKGCTWPLSEQVYSNIVIRFTEPEPHFDALGLCKGGATTTMPRMQEGGKVWVIDKVTVPSGKHVTSTPGQSGSSSAGDENNGANAVATGAQTNGHGASQGGGASAGAGKDGAAADAKGGAASTQKGGADPKAGGGDKGGAAKPAAGGANDPSDPNHAWTEAQLADQPKNPQTKPAAGAAKPDHGTSGASGGAGAPASH